MLSFFKDRSAPAVDDSQMTLIEHLEDLRRVLIVSLVAWAVSTVICFFFWGRVFGFLMSQAHLDKVYFFDPAGAIFVGLKIAGYCGIVLAFPIIAYQIWWFVSPGLHLHERKLIGPILIATIFFFLFGLGFALFCLPLFMKILTGFAPSGVFYLPDGDSLLSFILALIIGFGLVFEVPLVIYVLGLLGIIKSAWLYKNRLWWVLGLGVLANLLTPGVDPVTPLLMFGPLWLFWEGSALLLKLGGR